MRIIGMFSEINVGDSDGSINDYLVDEINYDREKLCAYLENGRHISSCSVHPIGCITKQEIGDRFRCYTDDDYVWADFLPYHIRKYNLKMPDDLIKRADANIHTKRPYERV